MNAVDFVIAYENDELENHEIVAGFQALINDGSVWHLQGSYGRTAALLIEQGYCTEPSGELTEDAPSGRCSKHADRYYHVCSSCREARQERRDFIAAQ